MISMDVGTDLVHIYEDIVGMVKASMKVQQWCCTSDEDLDEGAAMVQQQ